MAACSPPTFTPGNIIAIRDALAVGEYRRILQIMNACLIKYRTIYISAIMPLWPILLLDKSSALSCARAPLAIAQLQCPSNSNSKSNPLPPPATRAPTGLLHARLHHHAECRFDQAHPRVCMRSPGARSRVAAVSARQPPPASRSSRLEACNGVCKDQGDRKEIIHERKWTRPIKC